MNPIEKDIENLEKIDGELRKITKKLANEIRSHSFGQRFEFFRMIADNISNPIILLDDNGYIQYSNSSASSILKGINKKNPIDWSEIFQDGMDLINESKKKMKIRKRKLKLLNGKSVEATTIPLLYNGFAGIICILND